MKAEHRRPESSNVGCDPTSESRSYARVARSYSLEEKASETARATREEVAARISAAPYRFPALPDEELDHLAALYAELTGARITGPVRGLLAGCARRHGPDTVPLMTELYRARGSTVNLLIDLRDHTPHSLPQDEPHLAGLDRVPRPADLSLGPDGNYVGLSYGPHNRPPFDSTSRRRYDDRPSAAPWNREHALDAGDRPSDGATAAVRTERR